MRTRLLTALALASASFLTAVPATGAPPPVEPCRLREPGQPRSEFLRCVTVELAVDRVPDVGERARITVRTTTWAALDGTETGGGVGSG